MDTKSVPLAKAEADVELALRRVALLHAALAQTLISELGPEEGRRLVEAVIDRYGEWIGQAARDRAQAQGLDLSLDNWQEDLPEMGFDLEVVGRSPLRARIKGCVLARVWQEMGLEDLGQLYCMVDQAKYRAFNPNLTCRHEVHTLRDKSPFCELVIE